MKIVHKILHKLRVSRKLISNASISYNKKNFIIPLLGDLGYGNLTGTEPWMIDVMQRLVKSFSSDDELFIDVGVNIGQTLLKLRSLSDTICYTGFEPNPTCVYYVKELIKANKFRNISIVPVGISESPEILELQLYGNDSSDSSASMVKDFRPTEKVFETLNIPVFPLTYTTIEKRVKVIKIDVEGAELEVIKGCMSVIQRDQPVILMEILPAYHKDNVARVSRQNELFHILSSSGYHCLRILKNQENQLASLCNLSEIDVNANIALSDYIWIHSVQMNDILSHFSDINVTNIN